MDTCSSMSALSYRRSKPLGKVRRRVQDLRIPSSSSYDFITSRPGLDLSHNESARLAADCLLSRGLEGYHEVLKAEGEVDFLSELEKNYILENGRDDNTDDPDAPHDDDRELDSLSAGSQSPTMYLALSTDSDSTVAGLDQSTLKDVKSSDRTLDEPSVEVFFQSDSRAAGMKDLIRQFIRKANLALAIVIDSFSDIELLCDLLEASRKRNVSVHLLLDHLNLNLFVSMWQDLKLNSKNFPKLSVRSVHGQTYCAKTGRKLTGQMAESFIITDWTEVLTGSYSFSWLSWQVHRSIAVVIKGSSVTPFHQEFHRLYSSSKPVTGFVTFITVPHTLGLCSTSHAAQNNNTGISRLKSNQTKTKCHWAWGENAENTQTKARMTVLSNPQSPELEGGKGDNQPVHRGSQTQRTPPQLYPKPSAQPGTLQSVSVEKPKHTVGAVGTQPDAGTNVKPLEKNNNQIHRHSNHLDQTHFSYVQPQLARLTINTTSEKIAWIQESNPVRTASPTHEQHGNGRYRSTLKKNSECDHPNVGPEGLFFQQQNRSILTKLPERAAGLNTQKGQWSYSLSFKPKVELPSDNPKPLSPTAPATQQTQAKTSLHFPFTNPRGHTAGLQAKISLLETRRQDQPPRHYQPPLQSQPNTESPGSKSGPTGMATYFRPQHQTDSKTAGANMPLQLHTSQQVNPPPRLNWTPQNQHAARHRAVARQSSFSATYGTGQLGWRPFHGNMNTSIVRSKSMTDRNTAGFRGAGLNPKIT